jgi:microcystin degradation protein MlrC
VLFAAGDGPLAADPRRIPYRSVRRPIWPLDEATEPGLVDLS